MKQHNPILVTSGKVVFRSSDGLRHRPLLDHNHPFGIFRVAQFARAESIGHEYEHGLIPTVILRDHSYITQAGFGTFSYRLTTYVSMIHVLIKGFLSILHIFEFGQAS